MKFSGVRRMHLSGTEPISIGVLEDWLSIMIPTGRDISRQRLIFCTPIFQLPGLTGTKRGLTSIFPDWYYTTRLFIPVPEIRLNLYNGQYGMHAEEKDAFDGKGSNTKEEE